MGDSDDEIMVVKEVCHRKRNVPNGVNNAIAAPFDCIPANAEPPAKKNGAAIQPQIRGVTPLSLANLTSPPTAAPALPRYSYPVSVANGAARRVQPQSSVANGNRAVRQTRNGVGSMPAPSAAAGHATVVATQPLSLDFLQSGSGGSRTFGTGRFTEFSRDANGTYRQQPPPKIARPMVTAEAIQLYKMQQEPLPTSTKSVVDNVVDAVATNRRTINQPMPQRNSLPCVPRNHSSLAPVTAAGTTSFATRQSVPIPTTSVNVNNTQQSGRLPQSVSSTKTSVVVASSSASAATNSLHPVVQGFSRFYARSRDIKFGRSQHRIQLKFTCDWTDSENKRCGKVLPTNVAAAYHLACHFNDEHTANLKQIAKDTDDQSKEAVIEDYCLCSKCFLVFRTPYVAQAHKRLVHLKTPKSTENSVPCFICERLFRNETDVEGHMRSVHRGRWDLPYVCPVDGCRFRSSLHEDVLVHFEAEHSGTRALLCLVCLQSFDGRQVGRTRTVFTTHLANHLVKHLTLFAQPSERQHKCQQCRLMFTEPGALAGHLRAHHNVAVYVHPDKHTNAPFVPIACAGALPEPLYVQLQRRNALKTSRRLIGGPAAGNAADKVAAALPLKECRCLDCHRGMEDSDHYSLDYPLECTTCSYATSCLHAYAYHSQSHDADNARAARWYPNRYPARRPFSADPDHRVRAECPCGFGSEYGDEIADHLADCFVWLGQPVLLQPTVEGSEPADGDKQTWYKDLVTDANNNSAEFTPAVSALFDALGYQPVDCPIAIRPVEPPSTSSLDNDDDRIKPDAAAGRETTPPPPDSGSVKADGEYSDDDDDGDSEPQLSRQRSLLSEMQHSRGKHHHHRRRINSGRTDAGETPKRTASAAGNAQQQPPQTRHTRGRYNRLQQARSARVKRDLDNMFLNRRANADAAGRQYSRYRESAVHTDVDSVQSTVRQVVGQNALFQRDKPTDLSGTTASVLRGLAVRQLVDELVDRVDDDYQDECVVLLGD